MYAAQLRWYRVLQALWSRAIAINDQVALITLTPRLIRLAESLDWPDEIDD